MKRARFALLVGVTALVVASLDLACVDGAPPLPSSPPSARDAGEGEGDATVDSESVGDRDATSSCPPADVASFTPNWTPPAPFRPGVCTVADVDGIVSCLFGINAPATSCSGILWEGSCASCLLSPSPPPSAPGPFVFDQGFASLNVAGCMWNSTVDVAHPCVTSYGDREDCAKAACVQCRERGVTVHDGCLTEARAGQCAHFVDDSAQKCIDARLRPDGDGRACNAPSNFIDGAKAFGRLFCAGEPQDGGADAAAD
jgi:hypothetical protein